MTEFTKHDLERLDEDLEQLLSEATPVRARVGKNPTVVFSVRLPARDIDDFGAAARASGMSLSEFMRLATRAAISGDVDLAKSKAVGDVKAKARELNEAIDRLTA